jgi:hypothetical protein
MDSADCESPYPFSRRRKQIQFSKRCVLSEYRMMNKLQKLSILRYNILSRDWVALDGVLVWRLNLLTTLTHDSWLHLIIAPSLISTLYESVQHTPSRFQPAVFTSCSLVTASNSGDSSTAPIKSSLHSLPYNWLLSLSLVLRPTVSRPVCLGIKQPSGAYDQIFINVWQLRVCWFGAPSLTRGRVSRLQLLLVLASAVIFGFKSHRTRGHILLS